MRKFDVTVEISRFKGLFRVREEMVTRTITNVPGLSGELAAMRVMQLFAGALPIVTAIAEVM